MTNRTARQTHVLNGFRTFVAREGRAPTYRELAALTGVPYGGAIYNIVQGLIERGHLARGVGHFNYLIEPTPDQVATRVDVLVDQRGVLIKVDAPRHITVTVRRST